MHPDFASHLSIPEIFVKYLYGTILSATNTEISNAYMIPVILLN